MWKETWPNSKAIHKHSYKISHSIYMETDKDKSHLTKLFYFQKAKRGGGRGRGPLQVWKQVLIKVKVRLSEEEPTQADTNLLTSPQGTATGLDPIPLAGPAWAWNGTNFTPGETWTRLCHCYCCAHRSLVFNWGQKCLNTNVHTFPLPKFTGLKI